MCNQRTLCERPQHAGRIGVRARDELGHQRIGLAERRGDLAFAHHPVRDVLAQLRMTIRNCRTMGRQQHGLRSCEQLFERAQILRHIAFARVDQDRAEPSNHVAGDRDVVLRET